MKKNWLFTLALIWVSGWVATHAWPSTWWFKVDRFLVVDAQANGPVLLDVKRTIVRPFNAEWRVRVRRWHDEGWESHCVGKGGGAYRVDAVLPTPLTLDWWTDGSCKTLAEGKYLITTQWVIEGGILPDKLISVDSNLFEVTQ